MAVKKSSTSKTPAKKPKAAVRPKAAASSASGTKKTKKSAAETAKRAVKKPLTKLGSSLKKAVTKKAQKKTKPAKPEVVDESKIASTEPKTPEKNYSLIPKRVAAEIVDEDAELHSSDSDSEVDDESHGDLEEETPSIVPDEEEGYEDVPKKRKSHLRPRGSSSNLPAPAPEKAVSTADPIAAYLNEIRKYPLLTREQELELAKKYYETKDPAAAQALVTANLRFVVKVAAEYSKFGAKLIDLVQEGNMGLMHAVRDFNPYKGVRLITYAVWWIRGYIQEYLLKQYSMVKIATTLNQKKLFYRLQKEKEALDAMGEHPNFKLIGERMGIPEDEVEQMANRLSGRDVSLNTPLDDGNSSSLMDLQKSSEAGVDDRIGALEELELLRDKLEELRGDLNEREKILLEERILADEPLTLQEIGEKYGITREAVRQAEVRLMKKIKDKYMGALTVPGLDEEAAEDDE